MSAAVNADVIDGEQVERVKAIVASNGYNGAVRPALRTLAKLIREHGSTVPSVGLTNLVANLAKPPLGRLAFLFATFCAGPARCARGGLEG
jgi:hypothetical protein